MYIFNVLKLFAANPGTIGSPSNYLLPLFAAAGCACQVLLLAKARGKYRLSPLVIAAVVMLAMELLLWLVHSFTALLFIVVLAYATAVFLGSAVGALAWLALKCGMKKRPSAAEKPDGAEEKNA